VYQRTARALDKIPVIGIPLPLWRIENLMPRGLRLIFLLPLLISGLLLQACATSPAATEPAADATQQRIEELSRALIALGDDIDSDEAQRVASVAIEYPLQLAREYQVSDPPLVHNVLVNLASNTAR
jgi:hypothetical protein